ncbi:MAG: hypothetical protein ACO1NX_08185 [Chitinophagaceae bacterium]
MTPDRMEHLYFLENGTVKAIIFLHGCLQVELNNATLTCYHGPVLLGPAADFAPAHPDYKNQLCRLINQKVKRLTETEKGLVITFADKELLFEKKGTKEILVITDGNGEWHSYPDVEVQGTE